MWFKQIFEIVFIRSYVLVVLNPIINNYFLIVVVAIYIFFVQLVSKVTEENFNKEFIIKGHIMKSVLVQNQVISCFAISKLSFIGMLEIAVQ